MRGQWGYREEIEKISKEMECKPQTIKKYTKKKGETQTARQSNSDSNKVCKIMQVTARPDYFAEKQQEYGLLCAGTECELLCSHSHISYLPQLLTNMYHHVLLPMHDCKHITRCTRIDKKSM